MHAFVELFGRSWFGRRARIGHRVAVVAAAFAVLGSMSIVAAPTAGATNFGSICDPPGYVPLTCVSVGYNYVHIFRWEGELGNQIPGIATATGWAITTQYQNRTDLNAYISQANANPDVWVTDWPYGFAYPIAWAACEASQPATWGGSHPNRWCMGQKVRYNSTWWSDLTPGPYDTQYQREGMACHELGHTVGLRHTPSTDSCMYGDESFHFDHDLSPHDVSHVNAYYP